jgi:two-component system, NarL family, response regulator DegU
MIRVLIADDHKMFAEGLSGALASVPDLNIVGVVGDGHEVAPAVTAHSPDVLLVDLEMPTMGGLEVLAAVGSEVPTIVVTMHASNEQRDAALAAGAVGFLAKSAPLDDLAAAVRAASRGVELVWDDDDEKTALLDGHRTPQLDPGAESLTAREIEILTLLGQGVSSTEELAERLFISQKTVKNHLASVFSKLSIADRTQAAVEAIRLGFTKPR